MDFFFIFKISLDFYVLVFISLNRHFKVLAYILAMDYFIPVCNCIHFVIILEVTFLSYFVKMVRFSFYFYEKWIKTINMPFIKSRMSLCRVHIWHLSCAVLYFFFSWVRAAWHLSAFGMKPCLYWCFELFKVIG